MSRPTIVVVGVGSVLMSDDGIGPRIVELLRGRIGEKAELEFVDAGTGGMNIVHAIAGRDKAIIVDCALMGLAAGEIRRFTPLQAKSVKHVSSISFHDVDIFKVLEISDRLGEAPAEIVIFAIEPQSMAAGSCLSESLSDRMPEYIAAIEKELMPL